MPVSPSETIQFRVTADKLTAERLQTIRRLDMAKAAKEGLPTPKKNETAAHLVEWVYKSQQRRKELERFYTDEWLYKLEPIRNDQGIQLRWRVTANDALQVIARETIGSGNKSEAFRVIVAFAAKHLYDMKLTPR